MMAMSEGAGGKGLQHDPIAIVAELPLCFAERQPGDGVDLVSRLGLAAEWAHRPVTNALPASATKPVLAGRKLELELAGKTGLLLDFTQGTVLVALALEGLALRETSSRRNAAGARAARSRLARP
jgi:hypothetical protein